MRSRAIVYVGEEEELGGGMTARISIALSPTPTCAHRRIQSAWDGGRLVGTHLHLHMHHSVKEVLTAVGSGAGRR